MKFTLPPLPYDEGALAPVISAETLRLHHGAHHKGYIDKLNGLLEDKNVADKSLLEIVQWSAGVEARKAIFNNAAQAWNHEFYWESLAPPGASAPAGDIAARLDKDFGGVDAAKTALVEAAVAHFGSGWTWLVVEKRKLKVITTHDAGAPVLNGQRPLLTIDVWEHAYYVDYRNKRPDYVKAVVEKLLNWEFAAANLAAAEEQPVVKKLA
ncbi:MAG: superoxide dismutase [Burkholderiales bacterium]